MEVNLSAIRENYRNIKKWVGPQCQAIGVVKGNAYGLGMLEAVKALKEEGCLRFAVATPDEALKLRENGINDPVLVMGPSPVEAATALVQANIAATLTDMGFAYAMSRAALALGKYAHLHLKVDTGMGRIGFLPQEIPRVLDELLPLPALDIEGVFTHFSTADEIRLDFTQEQFRRFGEALESLRTHRLGIRLRHVCNSAALIRCPQMHLDAVRPGVILYGMWPSAYVPHPFPLRPTFQVKTAVAVIRDLPPGFGVGYSMRYVTRGYEKIAVLPIGYRDGYPHNLSAGKGSVLIRGKRFPIVGAICMDQMMVDVTSLPDLAIGEEVVLVGTQGEDSITPEEIAHLLGITHYAVPGLFSERVPRVFYEDSQDETQEEGSEEKR